MIALVKHLKDCRTKLWPNNSRPRWCSPSIYTLTVGEVTIRDIRTIPRSNWTCTRSGQWRAQPWAPQTNQRQPTRLAGSATLVTQTVQLTSLIKSLQFLISSIFNNNKRLVGIMLQLVCKPMLRCSLSCSRWRLTLSKVERRIFNCSSRNFRGRRTASLDRTDRQVRSVGASLGTSRWKSSRIASWGYLTCESLTSFSRNTEGVKAHSHAHQEARIRSITILTRCWKKKILIVATTIWKKMASPPNALTSRKTT